MNNEEKIASTISIISNAFILISWIGLTVYAMYLGHFVFAFFIWLVFPSTTVKIVKGNDDECKES